ncbi:MAG: amidohydrolase family protein [bacterium]|nr:amidohydrolase family protein [bacterium]
MQRPDSKTISIEMPCDMHTHLREGELQNRIVPHFAWLDAVVAMLNYKDPLDLDQILTERARIEELIHQAGGHAELLIAPLMNEGTSADDIDAFAANGIKIVKVMLKGVTTNSHLGVNRIRDMYPIFARMEELGMIASFHGELPNVPHRWAEQAFLPTYEILALKFPRLKIVAEHISTREGIELIKSLPENVVATLTASHMMITGRQVFKSESAEEVLFPNRFFRPVAKEHEDMIAIQQAAMSGNPKFIFGSDSAPHTPEKKQLPNPAAGAFFPPELAIPAIAEAFVNLNKLDRLDAFLSGNAQRFYGLTPSKRQLTLKYGEWTTPEYIEGIVPLLCVYPMYWRIDDNGTD